MNTTDIAERIDLLNRTLMPESAARAVINELVTIIQAQREALEFYAEATPSEFFRDNGEFAINARSLSAPIAALKVGKQ
jgi:hypothetical protein